MDGYTDRQREAELQRAEWIAVTEMKGWGGKEWQVQGWKIAQLEVPHPTPPPTPSQNTPPHTCTRSSHVGSTILHWAVVLFSSGVLNIHQISNLAVKKKTRNLSEATPHFKRPRATEIIQTFTAALSYCTYKNTDAGPAGFTGFT